MWVVRLSDKQLEVLRALLRSEEHLGPALAGAVTGFLAEITRNPAPRVAAAKM